MRVVNEEARSRGKRPDSKGSSEIEATRLPWRVRVGRRQESQQPEGGGAGHARRHSKGGAGCSKCGRKHGTRTSGCDFTTETESRRTKSDQAGGGCGPLRR